MGSSDSSTRTSVSPYSGCTKWILNEIERSLPANARASSRSRRRDTFGSNFTLLCRLRAATGKSAMNRQRRRSASVLRLSKQPRCAPRGSSRHHIRAGRSHSSRRIGRRVHNNVFGLVAGRLRPELDLLVAADMKYRLQAFFRRLGHFPGSLSQRRRRQCWWPEAARSVVFALPGVGRRRNSEVRESAIQQPGHRGSVAAVAAGQAVPADKPEIARPGYRVGWSLGNDVVTDLTRSDRFGFGEQNPVAGENSSPAVDQDKRIESELPNTGGDIGDLLVRVRARIPREGVFEARGPYVYETFWWT